jgi:hypothetical protein
MRILICGDSYSVADPNFPGLHWSEKILDFSADFEVCNLAYGGCSNAMIILQLLQGLNLNPDFVIVSFTNEHRYELDKNIKALPRDLTVQSLAEYQKNRYTTNMYVKDTEIDRWMAGKCSDNFEKLKNYFYIAFCMQTLKQHSIPFAFSLGGFEYKQDYSALINSNYVYNFIKDYTDHELKTNLWYHGTAAVPCFHVADDKVQTLYANECIDRINIARGHNC